MRRVVSCFVLLVAIAPTSHAAGAILQPKDDPFYSAPGSLDVPNGTILRTRRVEISLQGLPVFDEGFSAYQLLYRTEDASDLPTANVTTLIIPNGDAPAGGRKLVSLQDPEDSLDWNCAPSYQLQVGQNAPSGEKDNNLFASATLTTPELLAGRVVVIPDPEGPTSDYVVRKSNAHMVLDSIRAAENFAPAQLNGAATQVALTGYSGGGWESAVANELAPTYAPELNIVAATAGGIPVANDANVRYIDGSLSTGVLMAVTDAIARAYHQEDLLVGALNAKGKAFLAQVQTGCATSVFAAPLAHFDDWTTEPNFFGRADIRQIMTDNQLGHGAPTAPTFYYNGVYDEIIWIEPLDALVAEYCAAGTPMTYVRDQAGIEHIQGAANYFALALGYVEAHFDGVESPTTCGLPYNSVPPLR